MKVEIIAKNVMQILDKRI